MSLKSFHNKSTILEMKELQRSETAKKQNVSTNNKNHLFYQSDTMQKILVVI